MSMLTFYREQILEQSNFVFTHDPSATLRVCILRDDQNKYYAGLLQWTSAERAEKYGRQANTVEEALKSLFNEVSQMAYNYLIRRSTS